MVRARPPGQNRAMMKLLVVDSSELIRTSLLGLLEEIPGINAIHTATTLAQARISVARESPTLVVLAAHLPDGNAIEIIPTLKRLAPAMLIAVFTNDADDFNRRKCLEAGADLFFDKSIEFGDLLTVVRRQAALTGKDSSSPDDRGLAPVRRFAATKFNNDSKER